MNAFCMNFTFLVIVHHKIYFNFIYVYVHIYTYVSVYVSMYVYDLL